MRRKKKGIPKLCHHKATGQAFVWLDGKNHYLGVWGRQETRKKYQILVSRLKAGEEAGGLQPKDVRTVYDLAVAYLDYAKAYYKVTQTYEEMARACRPLVKLFEDTLVYFFGPRDLKALQAYWVGEGLSRKMVNRQVNRIRQIFKWGVSEGIVPPDVLTALQAVSGLRKGHTEAPERPPIRSVPWEQVEPVLAVLPPHLEAMILVQWHTGCRPGEICTMRAEEIVTDRTPWVWAMGDHKTAHLERERVIFLGGQAREVLAPWLEGLEEGLVFPVGRARDKRFEARRATRQSKLTPSQRARDRRNARYRRRLADKPYETRSYRQAINRACKQAGVESWNPNQIRHTFATRMAQEHGRVASQVLLGHSTPTTTAIYTDRDHALAAKIMEEQG